MCFFSSKLFTAQQALDARDKAVEKYTRRFLKIIRRTVKRMSHKGFVGKKFSYSNWCIRADYVVERLEMLGYMVAWDKAGEAIIVRWRAPEEEIKEDRNEET